MVLMKFIHIAEMKSHKSKNVSEIFSKFLFLIIFTFWKKYKPIEIFTFSENKVDR